jgi:hypothetical protein
VLLVGQGDPADVLALAVGAVDPSEAEPVLGGVQFRQSAGVVDFERVALHAGLARSAFVLEVDLAQSGGGEFALGVEPLVQPADVLVLRAQLPGPPGVGGFGRAR